MLQKLTIQNYALIDQLELEFQDGLNIITGETGAGKSILLGALSLILGQRADSTSLLDSSRKSIVEGLFSYKKGQGNIKNFFRENELDQEKSIIIRREISAEGKSRAFINDTPVNLHQLKELGSMLIDIHSQHETLLLNKSDFQLATLDAFAGVSPQADQYRTNYKEYLRKLSALDKLIKEEQGAKAEQDYFQFQFSELDEANLKSGEQEELETELQTLSHAEEISSGLDSINQLISSGDANLIQRLHEISMLIQQVGKYNSGLQTIADRVKSTEIELKDIAVEIESASSDIQHNPARIEIINERLNIIYRLQQKHRLKNVDELLKLKGDLNKKLADIGSLEDLIKLNEKECQTLKTELLKFSGEISAKRNKTIPSLELEIKRLLKEVGMPNAVLKIENIMAAENEIGPNGKDSIRFLFSANKGVAYSDLSKVASGGELSRLMLCVKSSVARLIDLPSLIFDEIDTGVSGETAFKIGQMMQGMSSNHQLFVITHLPQIAGRGKSHFYVYKEILSKKTYTRVKSLTKDERVIEVARMLSGDKPSAIAMENAKELMKA